MIESYNHSTVTKKKTREIGVFTKQAEPFYQFLNANLNEYFYKNGAVINEILITFEFTQLGLTFLEE